MLIIISRQLTLINMVSSIICIFKKMYVRIMFLIFSSYSTKQSIELDVILVRFVCVIYACMVESDEEVTIWFDICSSLYLIDIFNYSKLIVDVWHVTC